MCTLELLGRSPESLPPIKLVDAPIAGASMNVEGYVISGLPVIHLVTSSQAFRQADCFDRVTLVKLASIIAHEEWHVRHGGDERGAYEAQLMTLVMLGAGPDTSLHYSVRRSMSLVLKAAKAARAAAAQNGPARTAPPSPISATVQSGAPEQR
jgi:hypothetical protein